jgi:hypothetical protein
MLFPDRARFRGKLLLGVDVLGRDGNNEPVYVLVGHVHMNSIPRLGFLTRHSPSPAVSSGSGSLASQGRFALPLRQHREKNSFAFAPASPDHFPLRTRGIPVGAGHARWMPLALALELLRSGENLTLLGETGLAGGNVTCTQKSLTLKGSSLFSEMLSLLICVRNFAKSRCSAAISL